MKGARFREKRVEQRHASHSSHATLALSWEVRLRGDCDLHVSDSSSKPNDLRKLRFPKKTEFVSVLTKRVNASFEGDQSKAGGSAILKKTAVIALWCLGSYLFLLFGAQGYAQCALGGLSLALAIAGIGFCVQHDGGHGSYSDRPRVNRWAALSLDLIGGSSWIWKSKHNYLHHYFTNVDGVDADLQDGTYMRLSPLQPHRPVHRWQHFYAWFLYGLLPIKWHFLDDFQNLTQQKVGEQHVRLEDPKEIRTMLIGKVVFFAWALLVPTLIHGWAAALVGYVYVSFCLGVTLAVVFQLAHCVQSAEFVEQPEPGQTFSNAWAEHQLRTTVNFAPRSPFWTWYLGGLNYQVEHHLFPKISHIHYPDIASTVKMTCQEFSVPYKSLPSVGQALISHYRFLKALGRP